MLRFIFVAIIVIGGLFFSLQSAFYSLLFYLWLAYFRPEQWLWADSITWLNLSLIIGIWTVLLTLFSRVRLYFDLRVGLIVLFLLQSLFSVVFSNYADVAFKFWIDFAKFCVIAYLISVHGTTLKNFRLILLVIGLSLGFEGAKQGWAQLVLNPGGTNNNDMYALGDNNGVAIGMLMLVPILTAVAATASARWQRLVFQFMAIGVVYRALSTYSRGGFLAAIALGLVYIFRSQRRVPALAGVILAAVIILPVLPTAFWDRMSTIETPEEVTDASAVSRLHFWHVATLMANRNPVVGVGHNVYNLAYDEYDDAEGHFGVRKSVHSAWFGVAAELGYPGLLLFVAQIVLAFAACRRAKQAAALSGQNDFAKFAFAIEGSLVAFCVGGTFIPFQYTEMVWHVIGLSIALNAAAAAALVQKRAPEAEAWQLGAPMKPNAVAS